MPPILSSCFYLSTLFFNFFSKKNIFIKKAAFFAALKYYQFLLF
nr:MAG TPA: hypothetical protein [Caudoviricetes sp.]